MAGKDYTVASISQMFGGQAPKPRETEDSYFARLQAADKADKDKSALHRTNHVKATKFTPSTVDLNETATSTAGSVARPPGTNNDRYYGSEQPPKARNRCFKEIKREKTLLSAHQDRTAATSPRLDTSASGLARSDSTSSKKSKRTLEAIEIYFSPVDVNRSTTELSSPMPTPPLTPDEEEYVATPTQESFDSVLAAQDTPRTLNTKRASASKGKRPVRKQAAEGKKKKLVLGPEELDRLVKALAAAPFLNMHVHKQWLEDKPSVVSLRTALEQTEPPNSTPALTDGSSASSGIYSHPNEQFLTEQRTPSIIREILEDEFARAFPGHPEAKKSPRPDLGGIALTDPKIAGSPIRYVSKGYHRGSNVLRVGVCTFLNVPYGSTTESVLRIEPPGVNNSGSRVMFQLVNQVLERNSGKKIYLLVAEVDVTESFTKAALTELVAQAGLNFDDIDVLPYTNQRERESSPQGDIDWCALVDEMQDLCTTTDLVEAVTSSFSHMTAETCTIQTLTLMSELDRIKSQHQDFLITHSTGMHANGVPSSMRVPWISQSLDRKQHGRYTSSSDPAARQFRMEVASIVAKRFRESEPFVTKAFWGGDQKTVRFVPLVEDARERNVGWICFVRDEFET